MNQVTISQNKQEFIKFVVRAGALRFGEFVTKSGRKSPYFFNFGEICTGSEIKKLGEFYAHIISENIVEDCNNIYGPAYKGIPLAVTAAIGISEIYKKNVTFTFNRKEAKDHGEGGTFVGHRYKKDDRIVIVEDVTTAGTSLYESIPLLQGLPSVNIIGIVVAIDRQERGASQLHALREVSERFNIPAYSIVNLDEIVSFLHNREIDGNVLIDDKILDSIQQYRRAYG